MDETKSEVKPKARKADTKINLNTAINVNAANNADDIAIIGFSGRFLVQMMLIHFGKILLRQIIGH